MTRQDAGGQARGDAATGPGATPERRPFRAAEVLTGRIDQRRPAGRGRKQISAQLDPAQIRLLGELHARLNATATSRIEKSDLVGLGIELLAATLNGVGEELDPAPDPHAGGLPEETRGATITDLTALRSYVRTHVRGYEDGQELETLRPEGRNRH